MLYQVKEKCTKYIDTAVALNHGLMQVVTTVQVVVVPI